MVGKITEILTAWYSSYNPSDEEKDIAINRAETCDGCEYKVELEDGILKELTKNDKILNKFKCGQCGCPLAKKIFSPYKSACPLNKWEK